MNESKQHQRSWWCCAVIAAALAVLTPGIAIAADSSLPAGPVLVGESLPAATAVAAGSYRLTIHTDDRFVAAGEKTSVWGTVLRGDRRVRDLDVRLWARESGGSWYRTTQHVKTNVRGKFVFVVAPLSGRDYQVRTSGSASQAVRVGLEAKVVIAQKSTPVATGLWKLDGRVKATLKSRDVKVQRYTGTHWVTIAGGKVGSQGLFSIQVPAGGEGSRRYRAVVLNPKGGYLGSGYSVPLRVVTKAAPFSYGALKIEDASVGLNQPVFVSAKVSSRYNGAAIRVQQLTGDGWVDVGAGEVNKYGQARATAYFGVSGQKKLRLVFPTLDGWYNKGTTGSVTATIAPDCDVEPGKCTYEILEADGLKLFELANIERKANPQLLPFEHYATDELMDNAVECVIENATSGNKDLKHCYGENLYRGGPNATPGSIVAKWMASPLHAIQVMNSDNTYAEGAVLRRSDGVTIAALRFA